MSMLLNLQSQCISDKAMRAAEAMKRIPMQVHTCDIYGTKSFGLDKAEALRILSETVPGVTASEEVSYEALWILRERIDCEVNDVRGWRTSGAWPS
tara:strand:- start:381 stop:668 length:288 start_codon:yes stop_codon:yes gene_type:complete